MLVGDLLMKALLRAPLQLLPSLHARVTTKKSGTEDLDIKDMIKQVVMGVHRALEGGQFRFWSNLKVSFNLFLWHISVIWDIATHI